MVHILSAARHFPVLQANCYRSLHDHRYDIMPYMVMGAKVHIGFEVFCALPISITSH